MNNLIFCGCLIYPSPDSLHSCGKAVGIEKKKQVPREVVDSPYASLSLGDNLSTTGQSPGHLLLANCPLSTARWSPEFLSNVSCAVIL